MNFKQMLEDQRAFNRLIFDKDRATEASTVDRLRHLTMGMIEESLEFIRTFDFKVHRRSKLRMQNVAHSHEELIDLFKYWLSLVDLTNFPLEKLEDLYYAKSRVVRYRWQEEWQRQVTGPCVCVDIDQVLGDYIVGICDWAIKHGPTILGCQYLDHSMLPWLQRLEDLKRTRQWVSHESVGVTHLEWQRIKHHFRTNGGKRTLPVFADAKPFLWWCKQQGWEIILLTSRPVNEYPNIFTDTLTWLAENELPFDFVWWSQEKGERLEESEIAIRRQIVFAVDDSEKFVRQFRSKGILTFHLDRGGQMSKDDPYRVADLHDLRSTFLRMEMKKETV